MNRRISLWALIGIIVACGWVAVGLLAGPDYNPGRSTVAAITAPASLLGRNMPLGVIPFILLNGALYGVLGLALESIRRRVPRSSHQEVFRPWRPTHGPRP